MLPKGFFAKGVRCGIKKNSLKNDLAVFYSAVAAKAAGMFTNNLVKAAPVLVSAKHLKISKTVRAIVANSGCANACTGVRGMKDSQMECAFVAKGFKVSPYQVLVASTGVIGAYLPLEKIKNGLEKIMPSITRESDEVSAAQAIMTTDTFRKISSKVVKIDGKKVNIWGCTKGSGMIGIDMSMPHATTLSFILTDADIEKDALKESFKNAVNDSLNCVTVDGDTSTNDTAIILANGEAKNNTIKKGSNGYKIFSKALDGLCLELARMLAKDGEGATKFVEIELKGAKNNEQAKKIALTIGNSPLVKTAVFGCDANWGRILAAAGRAGVKIDPDRIDIYLGSLKAVKNGAPVNFSEKEAKNILAKKEVKIIVDLKSGKGASKCYTCDLSFDYIKINASYRS